MSTTSDPVHAEPEPDAGSRRTSRRWMALFAGAILISGVIAATPSAGTTIRVKLLALIEEHQSSWIADKLADRSGSAETVAERLGELARSDDEDSAWVAMLNLASAFGHSSAARTHFRALVSDDRMDHERRCSLLHLRSVLSGTSIDAETAAVIRTLARDRDLDRRESSRLRMIAYHSFWNFTDRGDDWRRELADVVTDGTESFDVRAAAAFSMVRGSGPERRADVVEVIERLAIADPLRARMAQHLTER